MSAASDIKPDNYNVNAKICRLVEKYPCMYDRSNQHYLKKDVVDKAWIKIAKEMEDSISSCKERWRNIRTSFARSINVNKIPSSANRTKPYYLHEELQFLAKHITPGIPVTRRSMYYLAGEETEHVEVDVAEESMNGYSAMSQDEDSQEQFSSMYENNNFSTPEQQRQNENQSQNQKKIFSFDDDNDSEPNVLNCPPSKRIRSNMVNNSPTHEVAEVQVSFNSTDFDAIFLQGILPEMKAMDFRQKLIFKRRIYEVISEIFENSTSNLSIGVEQAPTNSKNISMSDVAIIRRLSNLLQTPNVLAVNTVTSKNISSISSTVRSNPNATVSVQRGAQTRSSSNLLSMNQQPSSTSRTSLNVPIIQQTVKDEPEQQE